MKINYKNLNTTLVHNLKRKIGELGQSEERFQSLSKIGKENSYPQ